MTAEEILNTITSNGMRELTEARVIQAMEEYARQEWFEGHTVGFNLAREILDPKNDKIQKT